MNLATLKRRQELKFDIDVLYHCRDHEFKAMMDSRVVNSEVFYYIMSEDGQHEFVTSIQMSHYKTVGRVRTNDCKHVLRVLSVLNSEEGYSYKVAFRRYKAYFRDFEDLPF